MSGAGRAEQPSHFSTRIGIIKDGAVSIIYSHGVDIPECMLTAENLRV